LIDCASASSGAPFRWTAEVPIATVEEQSGVKGITDLAVLDVNGPDRTLRLLSTHPGVTVEQVLEASGCAIHVEGSVPQTRVPTTEELLVIREVLDPKGLRFKEVPVPKEETQ